ncbi:hypothetical protein [Williamsia muralis]|nr:hypothetical protein [Williamsia marianensis]
MVEWGDPEEREVTTELSAGISKWMPLDLSWSRKITQRWTARSQEFADDVSGLSGLSSEEIGQRVDESEELGEALFDAGEKAVRTPDRTFRSGLARLVVAGLRDNALVDEAVYLTSILKQLEPVHLRVLRHAAHAPFVDKDHKIVGFGKWVRPAYIEQVANLEPLIVRSSAMRLESLGLFSQRNDDGDVLRWSKSPGGYWWVTDVGRKLLDYCVIIDRESDES